MAVRCGGGGWWYGGLQLCWDGSVCQPSLNIEHLKLVISVSTAVLLWQLLDRTRFELTILFNEKRRKPTEVELSTLGILGLSLSHTRAGLWLQLVVCAWHPFPYVDAALGSHHAGAVFNKLGLLMFLRGHLVFRLIRDYSAIWQHRRAISKDVSMWVRVARASPASPPRLALPPLTPCAVHCAAQVLVHFTRIRLGVDHQKHLLSKSAHVRHHFGGMLEAQGEGVEKVEGAGNDGLCVRGGGGGGVAWCGAARSLC